MPQHALYASGKLLTQCERTLWCWRCCQISKGKSQMQAKSLSVDGLILAVNHLALACWPEEVNIVVLLISSVTVYTSCLTATKTKTPLQFIISTNFHQELLGNWFWFYWILGWFWPDKTSVRQTHQEAASGERTSGKTRETTRRESQEGERGRGEEERRRKVFFVLSHWIVFNCC